MSDPLRPPSSGNAGVGVRTPPATQADPKRSASLDETVSEPQSTPGQTNETFVRGGRPLAHLGDETATGTGVAGLTQPGQKTGMTATQRTQIAARLDRNIKGALRDAGPRLGVRARSRVAAKYAGFRNLLVHGQVRTGADAERVVRAFIELQRELTTHGLIDESTAASVAAARDATLDEIACGLGVSLTPRSVHARIVGLVVTTPNGQPSSADQRAGCDAARLLVFESERIAVAPQSLGRGDIALLDLRDALMRRSLELAQAPPVDATPELIESEISVTDGAIATVDALLAGDTPMTPELRSHLESLTAAVEAASPGILGADLRTLDAPLAPDTGGARVSGGRFDAGRFARRAAASQPTGPRAPGAITGPHLPQLDGPLATAPGAPLAGVTAPGAGGIAPIGSTGAPGAPTAPAAPTVATAPLDGLNRGLLEMMAQAPHGTTDRAGAFIDAYSEGMNAIEAILPPPLPFTYALPRTMYVDDGQGHRMLLPAGARVMRDGSGAYVIDTPGLVMQNGATEIAAGRSMIRLGGGVDALRFDAVTVSDEDSAVTLIGADAQIDRIERTSLIRADRATIDFETGQVDLVDAEMSFAPEGSHIGAVSVLYENGNDHLSMDGLSFDQSRDGDLSTVSFSGDNAQLLFGEAALTAEHLSMQMVRSDDPAADETLQMQARGLDMRSGAAQFAAAEATLNVVQAADGSSTLSAVTSDLNVSSGDSRLTTVGETAVDLAYAADGRLESLTMSSEQLSFADGAGNGLEASGGAMTMDLDEQGRVRGLSGAADSLSFSGDGGDLAATNGAVELVYDDGALRSMNGSAETLRYSGAGRAVAADGGSLGLVYGEGGTLRQLDAAAQDVSFTDEGTVASATGGRISAEFGADGGLRAFNGAATRFDVDRGGTQVSATDAVLGLRYGDDGLLDSVSAQSGATELAGDFGRLTTTGKTTLDLSYGDNGNLSRVTSTTGAVTYSGASGDTLGLTGGAAEISFYDDGGIQALTARAATVDYRGADATVNAVGGDVAMSFRPDGKLENVEGSVEQLDMTGAFGQLSTRGESTASFGFDERGDLSSVSARAAQLTHTKDGSDLSVTDGQLDATLVGGELESLTASAAQVTHSQGSNSFNVTDGRLDVRYEDGNLAALESSVGQGSFSGDFGSLQLADGGAFTASFTEGLLSEIHGEVAGLDYAGDQGSLTIADGRVDGRFAADGRIEQLTINATGLDMRTGDTHLEADAAQLEIIQQADGASTLTAISDDLTVTSGAGTLTSVGRTSVDVTYDTDGQVRSLNATAAELGFDDGAGNTLSTTGGAMAIQLDDSGLVTGVTGEATSVSFVGDAGELDVTEGLVELAFEDGGLRSAAGRAQTLHYNGDGRDLRAEDGGLSLVFGEGGYLQRAEADAASVSYISGDDTASVAGGRLTADFDAAGGLRSLDGAADQIDVHNGATSIAATNAELGVAYGDNGLLESVSARTGSVDIAGAFGTFTASDATVDLTYHDNGTLERASTSVGSLDYRAASGESLAITNGAADVSFRDDGTLAAASGSANVAYRSSAIAVAATGGEVGMIFGADGQLAEVSGKTDNLEMTGSFGALSAQGETSARLVFAPDGNLASVNAHATALTHTQGGSSLSVTDGSLDATLVEGELASVTASAAQLTHGDGSNSLSITDGRLSATFTDGSLAAIETSVGAGSFNGAFGSLSLTEGGTFGATFTDGLVSEIHGEVTGLDYAGDQGRLLLAGGRVDGTFGADGTLQQLELHTDGLDFTGTAEHGQPTQLTLGSATATVVLAADGSQILTLGGSDIALDLDGRNLGIESVNEIEVRTNAAGAITGIDADFPGAITLDEAGGDLSVRVVDLQGSIRTDPSTLSVSFSEAEIALRSEGLTATINDAEINIGEREIRVHVGDARLLQEIEGTLGFEAEVVGLDLVLGSGADGRLTSIDAAVQNLEANTNEFSIFVRSPTGQQLRLQTTFTEDGTAIRSVFMQIPDGGEVEVAGDDLHATFGPMTTRLTRSDDGALRLNATGFDVDATWNDLAVRIDSETIDVGLDPERGLVFNKISGTNIHVSTGGQNVDINIEAMDNLMLRMTGISGLAQGASLELVPTGPDSHLTASLRTSYDGIPISLEFDDLGALEAAASVQTNEVHVLLADPTGRGTITATAGPLELKGSAVEIYARYREYDPQRMLSAVGRFMSTDGVQLANGVSLESDGVLRIGTTGSGLFAETSVLLPRPTGAAPSYMWSAGQPSGGNDRGGAGLLLNLGGAGTSSDGTRYVGSVFVGAVPGSYLEIDRVQGDASVFGVPLPRRMTLPTTFVGGFNYRAHGPRTRVDATLGAFANPVGLVPEQGRQYLNDDIVGGAFGGVSVRTRDVSFGVDGLVDVNRAGAARLGGIRMTLGLRF